MKPDDQHLTLFNKQGNLEILVTKHREITVNKT